MRNAILALLVALPLALVLASVIAPANVRERALSAFDPNDPSNRVSGNRIAVDFGEQLFFEPKLSTSGKLSCGTCHVPERDWSAALRPSTVGFW